MSDLIGYDFILHLAEIGVITEEMARDARRVVIDAKRDAPVRMYVEMTGSDRLLNVSMREDLGVDIAVFGPPEE